MTKLSNLTTYIILGQLSLEEIEKQSEKYEELLEKAYLWEFGGCDDPYLRKSIYTAKNVFNKPRRYFFFTPEDLA